jgi:hypothetical protein
MSEGLYGIKPIKSANRRSRSNRRHFARENHRKKTSSEYEKKFRNVVLSQFSADKWIPCSSGYTRGQGWNCLHHAWIGYKRANNPKNGEGFFDRLYWAQMIQNIQTDLSLPRASFPQLSLIGDTIFLYDLKKQSELEDLQNEMELEEYKKKKKHHIQEIVDASMLTDKEIEMMREEFGSALLTDPKGHYVERVVMVDFLNARKNYHM